MKVFILTLGLLSSTFSYAAVSHECKISKFGDVEQLKVSQSRKNGKWTYTFKSTSEEDQTGDLVEIIDVSRSRFSTEEDLKSIMKKSGLKVENFINATAYITDKNNLGRSGLMVFKGGRGSIVAKSFFIAPIDFVEKCK